MRIFTGILFFLFSGFFAKSQISTGGIPLSWTVPGIGNPPVYLNYVVDNDSLQNDSLINPCAEQDSTGCAQFFAAGYPVSFSPENSGIWDTLTTGDKIWRLTLASPTAKSISLKLTDFSLPIGSKLFFYGAAYDTIVLYGAFTPYENDTDSIFISPPIDSNSITIEYNAPPLATTPRPFKISHLIHRIFKASGDLFSVTLPCHNNVNCDDHYGEYCNQIRSTVKLELEFPWRWENCDGVKTRPNETRWFVCSGVLLNNSLNDFRPLIYSARHCISAVVDRYHCVSHEVAYGLPIFSSTIVIFNLQSPTCSPTNNPFSVRQFSTGVRLVDDEWSSDQVMLEMKRKPPIQFNVFYSGWNRDDWDHFGTTDVTGIHHPKGDLKKISRGSADLTWQQKFYKVDWHDGVTEKGSSGSPLFHHSDKKVIGVLSWGINENCDDFNQRDRYARLRRFWDDVKDDLSPDNHSRVHLNGLDPIGVCQPNISINGEVFPGSLYRLSKPDITIQAANTIVLGNELKTEFRIIKPEETSLSTMLFPEYTLIAGSSIQISSNNPVNIPFGATLSMRIEPCLPFTDECGINFFNKTDPYPDPEIIETESIDSKNNPTIKIYPNPAQNLLYVSTATQSTFQIHDITGKHLPVSFTSEGTLHTINIGGLSSGVYFIQVNTNGVPEYFKFIKQ